MKRLAVLLIVFLGGFEVMVLEITGARFLGKDFGSSFYVWVSQIGVILLALALGAFGGGLLADYKLKASLVGWCLVPAGVFTFAIPRISPPVFDAIVMRHPLDVAVPLFWQKVDPALGSFLIFFFPCLVLAGLPTFMIRFTAGNLQIVGRTSGAIYAVSTLGSIVGVFVSGYVLLDYMTLSSIFKSAGAVMVLLGAGCIFLDYGNGERT
jgi:hypothetical protein